MDLVVARPEGLYCPPGDFYIDPWRPVERSILSLIHISSLLPGQAHQRLGVVASAADHQPTWGRQVLE